MTPAQSRAESIAVMRGILVGAGPVIGGVLVLAVLSGGVWAPALLAWLTT